MADIVERLRKYQKAWGDDPHTVGKSFGEAADEIERLRGISDGLIRALDAKVEEQRDEIERLRDLVERANNLAHCVFKGETKADRERARHNATVLINDIARGRP